MQIVNTGLGLTLGRRFKSCHVLQKPGRVVQWQNERYKNEETWVTKVRDSQMYVFEKICKS